jgi:hypothetical protein
MIDRIKPRFLSSDQDERLVPEGAMFAAKNVTISEMGEGTASILKNCRSTVEISPEEGSAPLLTDGLKIIGKVEDDKNGYIYFFAADVFPRDHDGDPNTDLIKDQHAIYRYDSVADTYSLILKSRYFNFDSNSWIKADIIHGTFGKSATESSIIYFTDNVNPPRKINIQRALNGEYSLGDERSFDYQVSVMRAAPNQIPTVSFETDLNRNINNIDGNFFQFATQVVYNDGEESAISPYSDIAVCRPTYLNALTATSAQNFSANRLVDNVINVKHNVDLSIPGIDKIRILCRNGNESNWFIADTITPYEDVTRNIDGSTITVFEAGGNNYKFYNDTLGSLVSPTVSQKSYDNVPLKARGQAIVKNRLFYSNYTEGFDNVYAGNVKASAVYSDDSSGSTQYFPEASWPNTIFLDTDDAEGVDIKIDLLGGNFSASTDIVPAGTNFNFSLNWFPTATISDSEPMFNIEVVIDAKEQDELWESNVFTEKIAVEGPLELSFSEDVFSSKNGYFNSSLALDFAYTVSVDSTVGGAAEQLSDYIKQYSTEFSCAYVLPGITADMHDGTSYLTPYYGNPYFRAYVTWDFQVLNSGGSVIMKPYIKNIQYDVPKPNYAQSNVRYGGGALEEWDNASDDPYFFSENFDTSNYPDRKFRWWVKDFTWEVKDVTVTNGTFTYDGDTEAIQNKYASGLSVSMVPTFKAGSTHSFGIVYYDKFGRHGFVNPIGSVYAKYPQERSAGAGKGPVGVSFELTTKSPSQTPHIASSSIPSWAERWQIVYAGKNTIYDFTQYEVGNAYPLLKVYNDSSGNLQKEIDREAMRIYVRIDGISKYASGKGVNRSYSFTKGDKLRVLKYKTAENAGGSGDFAYPTANNGEIIEFDVVGFEVLDGNDINNPLDSAIIEENLNKQGKYNGEFLVLEAAQINTGLMVDTDDDGSTDAPLQYVGFDWQHVCKASDSGGSYPYLDDADTEPTAYNHWGKRTIVDIVTPRKNTEEKVYYEIGLGGIVNTANPLNPLNHGAYSVTTFNGDAWYRPVASYGPKPKFQGDGTTFIDWSYRDLPEEEWGYTPQIIEDDSITDKMVSASWNRGRPNAIYDKSKEVVRAYSITWSDAYNVDVETLPLSSFNSGLVNYSNLSNSYGDINFIGNYDDMMLAIQENKVSITPVERAVLNQAAGGDGVVSLSSSVLNDANTNYLAGDWGVAGNPESVLIYDTQVFFSDASRGKILRLTREGLSPISEKGISNVLFEEFKKYYSLTGYPFKRVISGYDPKDNIYYVTILNKAVTGNLVGKTFSYDVGSGMWISEHSFAPDLYARQNDDMFSFKQATGNALMWKHTNEDVRNVFYGTEYDSEITVISKYDPSMPKIFNAISINGNSPWGAKVISSSGAQTGDGDMNAASFSELEDQYYRNITGDTSANSSSHIIGIGAVESVSGSTITMINRLRGINIPVGSVIKYIDEGVLADIGASELTVVSVDVANKEIVVSGDATLINNRDELVIILNSTSEGDRIRGHYAKIELTNDSTSPVELYSVDVNFTNSRPNYALGQ